ncbi:MAG: hypothetical protein E7440_03875 [Ruminococcaceae bacterium]|nr:hypothetical protein [Oscillospiraceae bacterium]
MKKEYLLPIVAGMGGIAGLALRRLELSLAYDPQLKLMRACPATWMLWGLAVVLLLLFAAGCRGMGKKEYTPQQWLCAPGDTEYILLVICAAFVLMVAGLVGLWEQIGSYRKNAMLMLTWVLCIVGGTVAIPAGRSAYRGQWSKYTPALYMGPSFATVVWLVAGYQDHARQPEMGLFVWQMLSGVTVVLALYGLVTLAVGKGGAGWTCVFCLMSISLSGITLADRHSIAFRMVYVFVIIYLAAQSSMLLRAAFGSERMPRGADADEQTEPEE